MITQRTPRDEFPDNWRRWEDLIETFSYDTWLGVCTLPVVYWENYECWKIRRVLFAILSHGWYGRHQHCTNIPTLHFTVSCRRLRWLGRWSACLLRSISWASLTEWVHTREGFFLDENWLAESTKTWVIIGYIRWKSTSSGNAEPYARQKMKARTGGEKGRHQPVTTACPEEDRSCWEQCLPRVRLGSESDD